MDENRDLVLANFQACTGIEDVEDSIAVLEQNDWDLTRAVNSAMTREALPKTSDTEMVDDIQIVEEKRQNSITIDSDEDDDSPVILASTSSPLLQFVISHDEKTIRLTLPANETVMALKKKIQEATEIPPCRQALNGWPKQPRTDSTVLRNLELKSETRLNVVDLHKVIGPSGTTKNGKITDFSEKLNLTYNLDIHNESNDKRYNLVYPGEKSILDVKTDVYALTKISYRHQEWLGWPDDIKDDTLLGCAGIDHPTHSLTLRNKQTKDYYTSGGPENSSGLNKKSRKASRIDSSDDSSVEEYEDAADNFNADDDIFITDSRSRKLQPLIPDNVEDETAGCLHFVEEFAHRYGGMHPEFFTGSLEDAIKEACMKPAKDRRLLALYLHHDGSVLANVFCTQLLCCDSVIQMLAAYFVLWAWDLTYHQNFKKFLDSVTESIGAMAAVHIKNIPMERLPAIVIINRVRSGIEISSVIQGDIGPTELMSSLSETLEVFLQQQKIEIKEEEERTAREMILHQQDEAYRASLEQDRLKEELRRQQLQQETEQRQREEKERLEKIERREAERRDVANRLPAEPPKDAANISVVRVRLPTGSFLERRFLRESSLQTVFDWLHVEGFTPSEHKLITSFPRRDLSTLDLKMSFEELNLPKQETLILEER